MVRLDAFVCIPLAARTAVELYEADATLDHAAGEQTETPEGLRFFFIDAVFVQCAF